MKSKLKAIIELIVTIVIGIWVVQRLAVDAMNPVDSGWHTSIHTMQFQKIKLVGLAITIVFFIVIWFRMLMKVIFRKDSYKQ